MTVLLDLRRSCGLRILPVLTLPSSLLPHLSGPLRRDVHLFHLIYHWHEILMIFHKLVLGPLALFRPMQLFLKWLMLSRAEQTPKLAGSKREEVFRIVMVILKHVFCEIVQSVVVLWRKVSVGGTDTVESHRVESRVEVGECV